MNSLKPLPNCDEVFERFFARWHNPKALKLRPYTATRPDVEGFGAPNMHADAASPLSEEGQQDVVGHIDEMINSARTDWPTYLKLSEPLSLDWIEAFDRYWTRARVQDLISRSDPSEFDNEFLVIVCEFGSMIGGVMREAQPQLEWLADWPYWESGLLDVPNGYRINVFHWAIKRFSESGLEDGYAAKIVKCLEMIRNGWKS